MQNSPGGECGPTEPVTNNRKVTVHAQANPYYPDGTHGAVVSGTLVWATPPEEEDKEKREHARDFGQGGLRR